MLFKSTTGPKAGASHYSESGALQNVVDIADRDKTQSKLLHEPTSITSHTDPITGNDVPGDMHPFVIDGIMKVYFESEQTRKDYLSTPFNHPVRKLSTAASADDDRGG
jgi:hypothetical protein